MSVIALIPARAGSKGIAGKNLRLLAGRSLMNRAIDYCTELRGTLHDFYVSSDIDWAACERFFLDEPAWRYGRWIHRPVDLAQDDTPMIAVVQHALEQIPGEPDDLIVLLQPTQPLRKPEHVTQAITLLRETQADSVVSVVPLPLTHHANAQLFIEDGCLGPYDFTEWPPTKNRQEREQTYIRDGTCYCFRRSTVARFGNIYGEDCRPLVIPAGESCTLDTEDDWDELERRWRERMSPLQGS